LIPILEANVRKNKHLAATIAAAATMAMLAGTSAFAEERPREETRRRAEARDTVRRERSARAQERVRGNESRNETRGESRNYRRRENSSEGAGTWRNDARRSEPRTETYRGDRNRSYERNDAHRSDSYRRNDSRRNDSYRGDRNRSYGNRSYGRSDRGQPHYHRGPVTRYERYGGGYRVWLGGARYPFYVPHSHWHRDRFRVGVVINLGGWYNRGGYYDYYDGYAYRATSRGDLRGYVESVDYGRDTFVIRNDATGSFVTVVARDRRARDVRPGDYVELSGSWTRAGYFSAYDVDYIDRDRY
jgi:hypothetical protein